jgi:hypothetical protein
VKTKQGRVCPLVCASGKEELNGKCVATKQLEQITPKAAKRLSNPEAGSAGTSCLTKCWAESQGRGTLRSEASVCAAACAGR